MIGVTSADSAGKINMTREKSDDMVTATVITSEMTECGYQVNSRSQMRGKTNAVAKGSGRNAMISDTYYRVSQLYRC